PVALPLLSILLFFMSSVAPRVLRSSPTRRFPVLAMGVPVSGSSASTRTVDFRLARGSFWLGVAISLAGLACAGEPRQADRHAEPDRKSTRLNSSHVEISYAVFCLKKKKKKKKTTD